MFFIECRNAPYYGMKRALSHTDKAHFAGQTIGMHIGL